ncbi:hypothetical protein MKL09_21370 [Methylobacterium sp. J-048]|uniref:hypothetical protein n=1 Tax=Methylobacterium sp. J-048 TaxID=2836635 RepID=UPI001FB8FCE0|nr:hypothetical protein [Methylobacterium sp. J-048]MCJ2059078.1 hypothetical protein [Methylobacterium sp. J-048]
MRLRLDPDVSRPPIRSASAGLLAVVTILAAPAPARAWGVPGCTNLPEYNRALGALQGMTSACDMSVEEARRVIAAHDGVPAVQQPPAPPPRVQARRHPARSHHRAPHHRRGDGRSVANP